MKLLDSLKKHSHQATLAAILALTFLACLPVLGFGFVFDDTEQIVHNPRIHSWSAVPGYFTDHVWAHFAGAPRQYYRPLFLVALRLCDALFGDAPAGWHLVSILMHLLVVWLVYRFLSERMGPEAGLMGGAVFALHPVHAEVVSWISAVSEPMMTAALLGSALLARRPGRLGWSLLLFAAALLCKETAIVWPAVLFVLLYEGVRPTLRRVLPFLAVAFVYLAVRLAVLGQLAAPQAGPPSSPWLLPAAFALYLRHLVWPVHLSAFYRVETGWLAAALLALALCGLAWLATRSRNLAVAVALLLTPLLPLVNIHLFKPEFLVQDRYLYLPSIGLAMLLALAFQQLPRPAGALLCLPLCLLLGWGLLGEEQPWRSNLSLYARGMETAPESQFVRSNLAREYAKIGRIGEATALLEPLLGEPQNSAETHRQALLTLAYAYEQTGRLSEAAVCLEQADQLRPAADIEAEIEKVRELELPGPVR